MVPLLVATVLVLLGTIATPLELNFPSIENAERPVNVADVSVLPVFNVILLFSATYAWAVGSIVPPGIGNVKLESIVKSELLAPYKNVVSKIDPTDKLYAAKMAILLHPNKSELLSALKAGLNKWNYFGEIKWLKN